MATPSEVMGWAIEAQKAGNKPKADALWALYDELKARPTPEAPVIPDPKRVLPGFTRPVVQAQQAEDLAKRTGTELALQKAGFIPPQDYEALKEREIERARLEIEKERGKVMVSGRKEPVTVEKEGLPFFRPTQIVEEPLYGVVPQIVEWPIYGALPSGKLLPPERELSSASQLTARLIRDPETGEMRTPTALEEAREAFARQTLIGEEEARRLALEDDSQAEPLGILATRESGAGVVETSAMAALRGTLSWISATLGEGYFRGLGYEVDADGNPVDPDDWGLAIAKARKAMGIPDVIEASLPAYATAAHRAGVRAAGAEKLADWMDDAVKSKWAGYFAVPAPGVATTSQTRKVWSLDPQGIRTASDVPIPSVMEDPEGAVSATTRRIAQNVAAGRSLGDEFRDAPEVAEFYDEVWGDPDIAYWVGLIPEMVLPGGPGVAAKGAAKSATALGKGAVKVADGAYRAANAAAEALAKADPEGLAFTALRLKGQALEMANTPGMQKLSDLSVYFRPGPVQDLAVTKTVARAVVKSSDLTNTQKIAALEEVGKMTKPGIADAKAAIWSGIARTLPKADEDPAKAAAVAAFKKLGRPLKLNMPGDFVQVTETMAVPRHVPGYKDFPKTVKEGAERAVRNEVERQPGSKALMLQRIARGNMKGIALAGEAPPLDNTAKALLALAEKYTDVSMRGGYGVRTPKLDKIAMKLIDKAIREAREYHPSAVRYAEKNFRSRRVSEMTAGWSTAEVAAVEAAVFEKRVGLSKTVKRPMKAVFDEIDPAAKRIIAETIKKKWIAASVGPKARATHDMTALQMYVKDVARGASDLLRYARGPRMRNAAVLLPGFRLQSRRIGSVQEAAKLKRQGREAAKVVERQLIAIAKEIQAVHGKQAGSVDEALNRMLDAENYFAVSRQLGRLLPADIAATQKSLLDRAAVRSRLAENQWKRAIQKMYPEADQEALVDLLKKITAGEPPTVKSLMQFDKTVRTVPDIEKVGFFNPLGRPEWHAPEYQKIMLDLILEDRLKPFLAAESMKVQSLISEDILLAQQGAKLRGMSLEALLADPGRAEALTEAAAQNIFHVPITGKVGIPQYGRDMKVERKLAEGGVELVEYLEAVAPKHRRALLEVVQDAVKYVAGPFRLNAIQAAKYGYVVPNIPFLVYKGMEMPFKAAVMVGADTALRGMGRAAKRGMARLAKRQEYGGGIITPEGVRYSGVDLLQMAEREGIGYSAITANRVGTLAEDILSEVSRAVGGVKGRGLAGITPAQKTFYIRTAEALERSLRQGVFEARLIAGDTVPDAATAARQSQFDFDEVPGVIREKVAQVFQGAAEGFKLATELVIKGAQNPKVLTGYLKALEEHRQAADPYGLAGDQALTNFIVGDGREPDSPSYYVPIPFSRVVTKGIAAAAYANNAVADLRKFWNSNQSTYDTVVEIGMESGVPIFWSTGNALLPDVLDSFEAFDPIAAPEEVGEAGRQVPVEKLMWAHALIAANNDPLHEPGGQWEQFNALWEPVMVKPPTNRAVPDLENYWRTVPPGMPYIIRGQTTDEGPNGEPRKTNLYMGMKLSKRGELTGAVVRSLTPDQIEKLAPLWAAYKTGGKQMFDVDDPEGVHATGVIKGDPYSQALNLTLNPTGINFNDPEGVQKALAESALVGREVTE